MPLRLEYFASTDVPVEVEGLIPSAVRGKRLAEIERFEIAHGNRRLPLAEMFRATGDAEDGRLEFFGNLAGVHWIGAHLDGGEIRVEGNAGRHVGSEMSAGAIVVEGDASDWVGGQMRGGFLRVRGRAGHLVGAGYRGSPQGMAGGTILVDGPAGNEVGHGMRRGLIAVGAAGDAAGFNMLAGTLLVFGPCGIRAGAGMKRGTIGLFGPEAPRLLPTFRRGCRFLPPFLPVLARLLASFSYPVPPAFGETPVELHHGDFVSLGRGEILVGRG